MKTQKMIVLSGLAMLLLAMMINLNVAVAHEEPDYGLVPTDDIQVYFLKKSFDFCNDGRSPLDIPGGSVPDGMDVQTSGCVDRWTEECRLFAEQDRRDNYAFTGEQIAELVVARDLDGAIAMTHAILQVDGDDVAYCNDVTADFEQCAENAFGHVTGPCGSFWGDSSNGKVYWRGHEIINTNLPRTGILAEYPPQKSEATEAGFDEDYDKIYECLLTVTDDMDGELAITVKVIDSVNDQYAETDDELFFFNPEVSVDVSVSDGTSIEFEEGYAGDLVYSTNKLLLVNDAEGGVDIAVWLGGTDLTSPDMAAKCPWSNVLDVEDAMEFKCNLDNGLYIEQTWQQVKNKNSKEKCKYVSDGLGGVSWDEHCLGLHPLFEGHENVLENQHEADCSFKLRYPVPCIGDFTDGNLVILMRAV